MFYVSACALAILIAACGGGAAAPHRTASCGLPIPGMRPYLALSYPEPESTGVPANVGEVILAGFVDGVTGSATVSMTASNGSAIPLGAPTTAPSPMPTPYAVPDGWSGNTPFVAFHVPALSPKTTYTLSYSYTDSTSPPVCSQQLTHMAGSFTTQ